jgi:hypothetical protein
MNCHIGAPVSGGDGVDGAAKYVVGHDQGPINQTPIIVAPVIMP